MFWFWFFVGPALVLAFLSLRGERRRAAYVAEMLAAPKTFTPPATVIVPVKGEDEGLRENLASGKHHADAIDASMTTDAINGAHN